MATPKKPKKVQITFKWSPELVAALRQIPAVHEGVKYGPLVEDAARDIVRKVLGKTVL
jgi:hypothetical protein